MAELFYNMKILQLILSFYNWVRKYLPTIDYICPIPATFIGLMVQSHEGAKAVTSPVHHVRTHYTW